MKKTVIIDNTIFSLNKSSDLLINEGVQIAGKSNDGDSGINLSLDFEPDIIIVGNVLPDMEGMNFIQILKSE